jgi:hypothetical protein
VYPTLSLRIAIVLSTLSSSVAAEIPVVRGQLHPPAHELVQGLFISMEDVSSHIQTGQADVVRAALRLDPGYLNANLILGSILADEPATRGEGSNISKRPLPNLPPAGNFSSSSEGRAEQGRGPIMAAAFSSRNLSTAVRAGRRCCCQTVGMQSAGHLKTISAIALRRADLRQETSALAAAEVMDPACCISTCRRFNRLRGPRQFAANGQANANSGATSGCRSVSAFMSRSL